MVWNLFGKSRKEKKAADAKKAGGKSAIPPVMDPNDTRTQIQASPKPVSRQADAGASADPRMDAMTVMAAIESAKQELAARDRAIAASARAQKGTGIADPNEDPVARKKRLIQAALTVHKMKQPALNELTREERARLRGLAESALGVGKRKPKS